MKVQLASRQLGPFAAFLVFAASTACAHIPVVGGVLTRTTTITGTVTLVDGTPATGAEVVLDGTSHAATVDNAGQFVIRGVARGEYDLGIRGTGISDLWIPAVWANKETIRVVAQPHSNPPLTAPNKGPAPLIFVRADPDSLYAGAGNALSSSAIGVSGWRIEPEQIASISVVKGRRGSYSYGASASYGVIMITLKTVSAQKQR